MNKTRRENWTISIIKQYSVNETQNAAYLRAAADRKAHLVWQFRHFECSFPDIRDAFPPFLNGTRNITVS